MQIELRFFRNFIIYVWEAIYLSHYNLSKKNYVSSHIKFNLEHNQFKFHLIQTHDESEALNRMQTFYTKKMSNFYISTYVCPNCTKEPVVLYKTLYHPNISLMKITQQEEHKDINIKPIRILKHGRKAKSLVKYGLEEISTILMRPAYNPKFDVFKFLSCT